jgi:hypothetical protein
MSSRRMMLHAVAAAALIGFAGCGQEDVTLPAQQGADVGECGEWYPGGEADAGAIYGPAIGDTLPCFVWESVRRGPQESHPADPDAYADAYLSMGELYLKSRTPGMSDLLEAQFGTTNARGLLFVVAANNCGTCPKLMSATTSSEDELLAEGIIPIGAASFDSNSDSSAAMDLVSADDIMVGDGLDESLLRTNDPEHFLGERSSFDAFPYVIGVRLSDMRVMIRSVPESGTVTYYDGDDGLDVELIEGAMGLAEAK